MVGELTGFPAAIGDARAHTVPESGGGPTVAQTGITSVGAIDRGPDGSLYVLEISVNSIYAQGTPLWSQVTRILPDGTRHVVVPGGGRLVASTGLAVTDDGTLYLSANNVSPGAGQLVRVVQAPLAPAPVVPEAAHPARRLARHVVTSRSTVLRAAGSTSSTSTPPALVGCTKLTRLPAVPRRGSS